MKFNRPVFALAAIVVVLAGCVNDDAPVEAPKGAAGGETEKKTNRIDLPANVRQNLGIRFAKVEKRIVSKTIRLPGTFELPPESGRVYTTRLTGQVEILVDQYADVKVGQPLYKLTALDWPEAREEILDMSMAVAQAKLAETQANAKANAFNDLAIIENQNQTRAGFSSQIESINVHLSDLKAEKTLAGARVVQLENLLKKGAGKAADLASARSELAATTSAISGEQKGILEIKQSAKVFEATVLARALEAKNLQQDTESTIAHRKLQEMAFTAHLRTAEMKFGLAENSLNADNWQTIEAGIVTAVEAGTVTNIHVTKGQWVDAQASILTIKDLTKLRFRAHALQGDLGLIKNKLQATIVPPVGSSLELELPVTGETLIAPESDPEGRISEILVINLEGNAAWARNGIRAEVEIVYESTAKAYLAIPVRALVRDGLDLVYFVRDPKDKNKVIREKAMALGPTDGVWQVLYGGIGPESEVVVEGAYELKLSNEAPKGGHFHSDGTFHAGDDH
ncbi:MAG: HlyD family efflux transporter periplasmic adaptor subunit [Planctomycetota bacterium]